ncbi:oxidative stress survival, Svf1-like protein [Serendipita vermifera]|nr:oxidative stress survival, Svf1-like protein [Serendipita vermifera]
MFSSLWSDPNAPNLHPVSSAFPPTELFGPLEPKDLEWNIAGGSNFTTETQIFYNVLEDGRFLMCQVVHSTTGIPFTSPTIQFTFKIYNPATKEALWKSINVNNFVTPPPGQDKRSCKSEVFTIVHQSTSSDPTHLENYTLSAKLADDLQILLNVYRPNNVSGFKVGNSPTGGFSYFGANKEKPDGYVIHWFWPRTKVTGQLIHGSGGSAVGGGSGSRIEEFKGVGMMVNAIQGMRPNLIATRWNFAWFAGSAPVHEDSTHKVPVSAIMMEFTTPSNYGRKRGGEGGVTVNIGCVSIGEEIVVTAQTKWADEPKGASAPVISRATHIEATYDKDTGYEPPQQISYEWEGTLASDPHKKVKADLMLDVGFGETSRGLIEKVDVLQELPLVIKKLVNMTGTKPYIYQWMQPDVRLHVHGPEDLLRGHANGTIFCEASYVS